MFCLSVFFKTSCVCGLICCPSIICNIKNQFVSKLPSSAPHQPCPPTEQGPGLELEALALNPDFFQLSCLHHRQELQVFLARSSTREKILPSLLQDCGRQAEGMITWVPTVGHVTASLTRGKY